MYFIYISIIYYLIKITLKCSNAYLVIIYYLILIFFIYFDLLKKKEIYN